MATINEVLNVFVEASGQEINKHKSIVFLPKFVCNVDNRIFSALLQIPMVDDLERYLRFPNLHTQVNKCTYKEVENRVTRRLKTWQGKSLSFAGRLILIQSVLATIPNGC